MEFHFILLMSRFGADTSGAALIYAVGPRFISGEEKNPGEGGER
jgi:hypothetical protein